MLSDLDKKIQQSARKSARDILLRQLHRYSRVKKALWEFPWSDPRSLVAQGAQALIDGEESFLEFWLEHSDQQIGRVGVGVGSFLGTDGPLGNLAAMIESQGLFTLEDLTHLPDTESCGGSAWATIASPIQGGADYILDYHGEKASRSLGLVFNDIKLSEAIDIDPIAVVASACGYHAALLSGTAFYFKKYGYYSGASPQDRIVLPMQVRRNEDRWVGFGMTMPSDGSWRQVEGSNDRSRFLMRARQIIGSDRGWQSPTLKRASRDEEVQYRVDRHL